MTYRHQEKNMNVCPAVDTDWAFILYSLCVKMSYLQISQIREVSQEIL